MCFFSNFSISENVVLFFFCFYLVLTFFVVVFRYLPQQNDFCLIVFFSEVFISGVEVFWFSVLFSFFSHKLKTEN